MSRSVNRATLLGNVGSDPEVKTLANGGKVASFSLATSNVWTDASGTKQERTAWHRCVAWNQGKQTLADIVEQYVKKGDRLFLEGEIDYRKWTDKDGAERYTTEIKVRDVTLLGGKQAGGQARESAPKPSAKAGNEFADFPGVLDDADDGLPF